MHIREGKRHRRWRVTSALVGAAIAATVFTGCTSPTSSLLQAATDARSAVSSAQLAVSQQKSDRTFITTTTTALGDAITELGSAEQSATEVAPSTPAETAEQKRTLREIRTATDAVLAAQRVVTTDAGSALPALRASTAHLTKLADELLEEEAKK